MANPQRLRLGAKVRQIWTDQTHPVRRHAGQHPRVVHRHHIHLKPVPLGLDAFITNAIAVRIGRTLAPHTPKASGWLPKQSQSPAGWSKQPQLYISRMVHTPRGILYAPQGSTGHRCHRRPHRRCSYRRNRSLPPRRLPHTRTPPPRDAARRHCSCRPQALVAIGAAHSVQDDFVGPIRGEVP